MGYRPVKGGAGAIRAAAALMARVDLDAEDVAIEVEQVRRQLGGAVDRVMSEGGLFAPELAALAVTQTEGDLAEAALLLRAYRSTLPRLGYGRPAGGQAMRVRRRISSAFKDVPGGQLLGRTRDYTHRLLDFSLLDAGAVRGARRTEPDESPAGDPWPAFPKVSDTLRRMDLMTRLPGGATAVADGAAGASVADGPAGAEAPFDVTRDALRYPVPRSAWLQALARGETGAMVCLAYSNLRGYGFSDHGTIGELRVGELPLRVVHPVTGQPVTVGWFRATEVEMFGPEHDRKEGKGARLLPNFGLSYGLVIGQQERKAIAMSILDSALQAAAEEGEGAPSNDQEMVLSHVDGIESTGFVEHLKLPHYVTFGAAMRAQEVPLGTRRMVAAGQALGGAPAEGDTPPERARARSAAAVGAAGSGRD